LICIGEFLLPPYQFFNAPYEITKILHVYYFEYILILKIEIIILNKFYIKHNYFEYIILNIKKKFHTNISATYKYDDGYILAPKHIR
jgi:hypothetical protein